MNAADTTIPAGRPATEARRERVLTFAQRWSLPAILLLVIALFGVWIPDEFLTTNNFTDIITSQPPSMFIALAAMLVLVVGEFDLSLGATLGLCQYLVLELITGSGAGWGLAVALTLGAGLAVGLLNAFLVVGLRMNAFIATIGVSTVVLGLLEWVSNENAPIFEGAPKGLTDLAQTELLGIVLPFWYAIVAAALLWIVLEYTTFGRDMRATGANRAAAFLSGVRTNRALVAAFAAAGLLAAIGGILATARLGTADATSGPSYLLPAYAAAFLGATAIRPGFFNVWGTVIAIFLVAVSITGLQLQGAAPWVTPVFNGAVLLLAVAVSNLAARHRERAPRREPDG